MIIGDAGTERSILHYASTPIIPLVQEIGTTTRKVEKRILVSLNWRVVCQTRAYKLI